MHIYLIDSGVHLGLLLAPFKIPNKDERKAVYYIFSFSFLTYPFYIVIEALKGIDCFYIKLQY